MATSSLGSLVVSLEANIAKFSTDMNTASAVTQKSMKGIEDAIGGAKKQFLSLAASVVSVGAAVAAVKGSIELGDQLKTMSEATGIAISKLDELSIMAKLNGADLDSVAKGFKGLNKAIIDAGDATSKQAKLFSALGVAVKDSAGNLRGVDEVMADTAKALNGIDNETTRAAVGTALFGKSYLQIAATLRNFQDDQKVVNEVLEKFGPVSVRAAMLSDELNDRLTLLGEGGKRALLQGLVPGIAAVSQTIQELINRGGSFQTSFGDVISRVAEFVSKSLISLQGAFEVVGTTIAAVAASIATGSLQPLKDLPGEIDKIEARVKAAQARIATSAKFPGLDDSDQISRAGGAVDRLTESTGRAAISSKKLTDILGEGAAKADPFARAMDSMQKAVAGANAELLALTSQSKDFVPIEKQLAELQASDIWKVMPQALRDQIEALAKVGIATQQATLDYKKLADASAEFAAKRAKEQEDWIKQQNQIVAQTEQTVRAYTEANDTVEAEIAVIGESDLAHQRLSATLQFEAERRKIVAATTLENKDAMDAELTSLEEQFRRRQELLGQAFLKDQFVQARSFLSDFFVDVLDNGSKAWTNLWDHFKQLAFRALADIAAKQIIVSITGAVGASAAGAAGAAGVSQATGGVGSLLGGVGSLFGIGGGSIFSAASGAGIGAGIETIKLAATAGLESVGGIGAVVGAMSTFLPIAGIAALAIPFISKLFDGGKKPPQEGGFGSAGVDVSRFVSQTQFDDALSKSTAAMVASFDTLVKGLGGTITAGFAQSISGRQGQNKEGTTAAFIGGQEVFRSSGVSLGKDQASIDAALQLESKRAILAALQASDIAPRFAEIIDSVAAAGASSGDIDRVLALAQSLQTVEAVLGPLNAKLGDTGLAAAEAAQQLIDAAGGADKFASQVAAYNDTFLTAGEKLDTAFSAVKDSFASISVTMPTSIRGFRDLVESLDLTTEAGRSTYSALLDVAPAFASVTNAVQGMISDIYSLQDSIHGVSGGDAALNQLNAAISAFVSAVPGFAPLLQQLGTQGFAANLANIMPSDLSNYAPSNIALIQSVLSAYNSLLQAGGGAGGATGIVYPGDPGYPFPTGDTGGSSSAGPAAQTPEEMLADMLKQFSDLVGQSTGNYGEKLALEIKAITGAISSAARQDMPQLAALLQNTNKDFGASLALFNDLSTRYTDDIAEQLVKLSESYKTQAENLQGNAAAIDVLNTVFEEQWQSIINGTAAGVDGTLDQLRKLQQGILDYVDSLKISDLSPLTAVEKIAEAKQQYEDLLSKANTGDQAALSSITGAADAYIKLKRDFDTSSPAFADFFKQITGELTALGTKQFAFNTALPMNAADQALLNALPSGSTLMSAQDLQNAAEYLRGAMQLAPPSGGAGITAEVSAALGLQAPASATQPVMDPALTEKMDEILQAIQEFSVLAAQIGTEAAVQAAAEAARTRAALADAITVGRQ